MQYLDFQFLIPTSVALVLGGALLVVVMRKRRLLDEQGRLRTKLARADAQNREQSRLISRLRSEKGSVASLALSLPAVVRELNRSDIDPRRVPRLILNLAEALFQPSQFLFYIARPGSVDGTRPPELVLSTHYGFGDVPHSLRRIPFGEGKIGWVASHRIDMLREDWLNPARTQGDKVGDNHRSLKADIMGPLVHHSLEGEQVLGVLCIGSTGTRPSDEKLMFQMVTNLGSLALVNSHLVTRLRDRANTDGLTSLLNKRYFMEELLARMIVAAEREGQALALFIFDIDHFKSYNDTNGHPAGDDLLRTLAELLRRQVRPGDCCCRYGGEEFIVAMPDTNREEAYSVADRIRGAVESFEFEHHESQPGGRVTISGGVAAFPHDGNSVAALTKHADVALYESKRRGRNRITLYQGVDIGTAEDVSGFDLVPVDEG
ncbi:MAG TPA: sensor domain-containing diguanylate cyclase [Candidatus Polarisedimenticolaceae bacterium]|nr:sensor domain-containing diguanylate cyclase [Candidatus Polarisedimenticolaceae bacterium]